MGRPLDFEALLSTKDFEAGIKKIEDQIKSITRTTETETEKVNAIFSKFQNMAGAYFTFGFLKDFTNQLINVRGEFQRTEIAFTTMLQSQEKSNELMRELVDLAAKTPFNISDVTDGAKRLLAFQIPAEEVTDTLRRMGDVAAGLGVPMGQLIHVYGQVKAQGKLMTNDLYQFMNAGIPILAELSKVLGKTEAEIKDMVGQGKIGFEEIQQVIKGMTNEGGLFFNLMEAQSASLTGQIYNLENAIEQMFNELGRSMEGTLSTGIEAVTYLVENYENLARVLVPLISSYGAYRTALMTTSAVQKVVNSYGIYDVATRNLQIGATLKQIAVQMKLNAVMMANPYAIAIAGVGLLIGVLFNLNTSIKSVEETLSDYNAEMKNNKTEAESLISVIKSETATFLEKADAVKKLQELAPETFANMTQEEIKAMDLAEAHKKVAEELENQRLAKEKMTLVDMEKELASLQKLKELNVDDADGRISSRMEELRKGINELKRLDKERAETLMAQNEPLEKQLEYWQKTEKAINEEIDRIKKLHPEIDITKAKAGEIPNEFAKIQTTIDNLNFSDLIAIILQVQRNIANVNNQIEKANNPEQAKSYGAMNKIELDTKKKEIQEKMYNTSDIGKINEYKSEIGLINKELEKYSETTQKATTSTKKLTKSQKSAPNFIKNSLGDLEAQLTALDNQIRNKTLISDQKTMQKLLAQKVALEKKIAEERAKIQSKSFDEETEEIKRQIELRDRLLQLGYSKETTDTMFPKAKDTSYLDYLQKTETELKKLMETGKGTKETAENLFNIQERIKAYNEEKTFVEQLTEQIEDLKSRFSGDDLLKQLSKVKNISVGDKEDTEEEARIRANMVRKAMEEERKAMQERYNQFLKDHRDFKEREEEINREYAELRKKAEEDLENGITDEPTYKRIILKIEKAESEAQTDLFFEELEKSDRWASVFADIENSATTRLQEMRKALVEQLQRAKTEAEQNKIKVYIEQVDATLKSREKFNIKDKIKEILNAGKDLKKAKKDQKQAEEEYQKALENGVEGSEELEEARKKLDNATKKLAESEKSYSEVLKQTGESMKEFANLGKDMINDIQGAFDDLGMSLDNGFGDALDKLSGAMDGVEKIAEGIANKNPVKIIAGVVKTISSLFNNDRKKERAIQREQTALKNLASAYEDLSHAANKAFGQRKYNSQTGLIQNLEQQKVHLQNMIRQEQSKKKTDHGKIADWQNQINAINRSIDDIKTDVIRDVLQTDVVDAAAKVGDALVEAFGKGEDAVESLDKVANDMLKNMLKNQLNLRLQEQMKPILDKMMAQSGIDEFGRGSFGGFTKEQLQNFKDEVRRSGEQMQGFLEAYKEIFQELENNADQSLKGSIKGITEQTADVLAGQMNAIRINIGEILKNSAFNLEVIRESIVILTQIEYHTRNLHQIKKDISEMNSKMGNNSVLRANG